MVKLKINTSCDSLTYMRAPIDSTSKTVIRPFVRVGLKSRATLQTKPFYVITVIRTVTWNVIGSFCPVALYNNFVRDTNVYNVIDVWTFVFMILAIICLVPLRFLSGIRARITWRQDIFVSHLLLQYKGPLSQPRFVFLNRKHSGFVMMCARC